MITTLAILFGVFLAYANGANDNFKGVATLFGSGTAGYRGALLWATATTFAGSLAAGILGQTKSVEHRMVCPDGRARADEGGVLGTATA